MIVAGREQGRMIKAFAYRNLSMHVTGSEGEWKRLAEAFGYFLVACLFLWLSFFFLFPLGKHQDTSDTIIGIIAGVTGIAFTCLSIYYFSRWLKVREALKMLERQY